MRMFKSGGRSGSGPASPAERVLRAVILALAAVLVLGTAYALAAGTRNRTPRAESTGAEAPREGEAVYTRIGTIRASTRDTPSAVVAANIVFPYPAADRAFREELDDKSGRLRKECEDFFSGKSVEELHPAFEGALKSALRDRLNGMLFLGKIREVWFSDYAVIQ